jgi:methyl-accepting chemotaxis protein
MFVSRFKRRILIGDLQYRLMVGNLLYLFFVVFAFSAALFGPLVASHQKPGLYERVWFAIPVIIVLCLLHSVVVSHRIAGPLHRFRQIFQGLARGDLSQNVTIRRHDYLRTEAAMIADMMRSMAARIRAIEDGHAAAHATLSELRQELERFPHRETAAKGETLAAQMDILDQRISQFRIPAIPVERPQGKPQLSRELVGSV